MKKSFLLSLCILMFLFLCSCQQSTSEAIALNYTLLPFNEKYQNQEKISLTQTTDSLSIGTTSGVSLFNPQLEEVNLLPLETNLFTEIAADKNYIVTSNTHLKVLNPSGELIKELTKPSNEISHLKLANDLLFVLTYDADTQTKKIAYYKMADDIWQDIVSDYSGFVGFDVDAKGLLYAVEQRKQNDISELFLVCKDLKKNQILSEHLLPNKINSITDINCSLSTRGTYVTTEQGLYYLAPKDKVWNLLYYHTNPNESIKRLAVTENEILLLFENRSTHQFSLRKLAPDADTQNQHLTLLTSVTSNFHSIEFTLASEALKEKYPYLLCEVDALAFEEKSKIITKLLAGDSDFDLFTLSSWDLLKVNVNNLQSLDAYPEALPTFDLFFSSVKTLASKQEKLIGIPYSIQTSCFIINPDFYEEVKDLQASSLTWNWGDYVTLARETNQDTNGDGQIDLWLSNETADNVIWNLVNLYDAQNKETKEPIYNDPAFRALLKEIKTGYDEGLFLPNDALENKNHTFILEHTNSPTLRNPLSDIYEHRNCSHATNTSALEGTALLPHFVLYPVIDSHQPGYIGFVDLFCINPYSKNKDLAAELLLTHYKPEIYIAKGFLPLYKDCTLYDASYEQYLSHLNIAYQDQRKQGMRLQVTPEYTTVYEQIYNTLVSPRMHDYVPNVFEFFNSYLSNDMTEDEFINALNKYRKQMLQQLND